MKKESIFIRNYATKRSGGSVVVTIPHLLLRAAQIDPGDRVSIFLDVVGKKLIIEKAKGGKAR